MADGTTQRAGQPRGCINGFFEFTPRRTPANHGNPLASCRKWALADHFPLPAHTHLMAALGQCPECPRFKVSGMCPVRTNLDHPHPPPIPPSFLLLIFAMYVNVMNCLYSFNTVLIDKQRTLQNDGKPPLGPHNQSERRVSNVLAGLRLLLTCLRRILHRKSAPMPGAHAKRPGLKVRLGLWLLEQFNGMDDGWSPLARHIGSGAMRVEPRTAELALLLSLFLCGFLSTFFAGFLGRLLGYLFGRFLGRGLLLCGLLGRRFFLGCFLYRGLLLGRLLRGGLLGSLLRRSLFCAAAFLAGAFLAASGTRKRQSPSLPQSPHRHLRR